jgi:hypothetical protein
VLVAAAVCLGRKGAAQAAFPAAIGQRRRAAALFFYEKAAALIRFGMAPGNYFPPPGWPGFMRMKSFPLAIPALHREAK